LSFCVGYVCVTTLATRQGAVVTGDYFLDETIPNQMLELGAQVYFKPRWLEDLAYIVRGLLTPATRRV
jgi:hypothetical protein